MTGSKFTLHSKFPLFRVLAIIATCGKINAN